MGLPNNPGEEGPRAERGHRQTTEVRDIYPHPAMPHRGYRKKAKQVPPEGEKACNARAGENHPRERATRRTPQEVSSKYARGGPGEGPPEERGERGEGKEGEGEREGTTVAKTKQTSRGERKGRVAHADGNARTSQTKGEGRG